MARSLPILLFWACASASALDLPSRSVSTSKQFIVYCEDKALRMQAAGFAEQTKSAVLSTLGQSDGWRFPIVMQFTPIATVASGMPPSQVRMFEAEGGLKIQIDVQIGADPATVALQSQIIRAVLLEYMYRDGGTRAGEAYAEPPVWLVESIAESARRRMLNNASADVFQTLIDSNHLPPIRTVLASEAGAPGSTWNQMFRAYSLSLLKLLLDLSQAQTHLAAFVRDMRAGAADPVAMLQKHFPELGTAEESLEKLWTLSVAKLSSADRYAGLSTVDTDQSLERLLRFELPPEREGQPSETLRLDDFARFVKRPTCRKLLAGKARALVELSTKANPLFRPVIAEYQDVAARLARGKTSGVQRRLKAAALYRAELLKRVDQIADYLNWMEATQMSTRSHAFDAYFEALRERDAAPFRADPITKYMNLVEAITR